MHPAIKTALNDLHAAADVNEDGKISKQDAQIVLGQLAHRADLFAEKKSPLGAMLIVAACAFGLGVLARMTGFPWVF